MKTFAYLATVYSKWPLGIEDAFQTAARCAARLLERGHSVYSPIAHTHPLAIYGGIDPMRHDIWLPADEPFMHAAAECWVVLMPGWRESRGVTHEIEWFQAHNKPVKYLSYPDLDIVPRPEL